MQEGDFLEVVTSEPAVVCHFFHRDFERCKILDRHLSILARKFFDTRFIKLSAPVRLASGPSRTAAWLGRIISPSGLDTLVSLGCACAVAARAQSCAVQPAI